MRSTVTSVVIMCLKGKLSFGRHGDVGKSQDAQQTEVLSRRIDYQKEGGCAAPRPEPRSIQTRGQPESKEATFSRDDMSLGDIRGVVRGEARRGKTWTRTTWEVRRRAKGQ